MGTIHTENNYTKTDISVDIRSCSESHDNVSGAIFLTQKLELVLKGLMIIKVNDDF